LDLPAVLQENSLHFGLNNDSAVDTIVEENGLLDVHPLFIQFDQTSILEVFLGMINQT
jgi:hypothetical protein